METKKYKKYQVMRESNPAFTLNQIAKIAYNRAKNDERYQGLEIITTLLMSALTMEAVLNYVGKSLFDDWEKEERSLNPKDKLKKIAAHLELNINLNSKSPFQFFTKIFKFRDDLVHAKSSKHFSKEIAQSNINEDGFPIVKKVAELSTDWEKLCTLNTAKKWRNAVAEMSSILSVAASCHNPIQIGDIIDTWGELET